MRVLVTGGFGFIGSRLALYLLSMGHTVRLGARLAQANRLSWLSGAEVFETDWNNVSSLKKACDGVDVVIHCSGMNASDSLANPGGAFELNGNATARLFKAANQLGVRRFIYLSTAHVYSSPLVGEINETTQPSNTHPYATSHRAGELAVLDISRDMKIKGLVVRLSNVFGSPANENANCWDLFTNNICWQAVKSGVIHIRSNPAQQRDFIPMGDVCGTLEALACYSGNSLDCQIFNVGSGKSRSLLDMASLIRSRCEYLLGFKPKLKLTYQGEEISHSIQLDFKVEKLTSLNMIKTSDPITELDQLILFCRDNIVPYKG